MGAPVGNTNGAKKNRMLTDALRRELTQNPEQVRKIAQRLIDSAIAGESWAQSLIHDRIDGKVPQAIVGDEESDPLSIVSRIERVIVRPDPKNTDS